MNARPITRSTVTVVRARSRRHWMLHAFGQKFGPRFTFKSEAWALAMEINGWLTDRFHFNDEQASWALIDEGAELFCPGFWARTASAMNVERWRQHRLSPA